MGYFNVALNIEDYFSGPSCMNATMNDFKTCVNKIEVMDINSIGLHYTWNQKPRSGGGVLKKLDPIMGNLKFVDTFPGAYGIFQPYRISDHSPVRSLALPPRSGGGVLKKLDRIMGNLKFVDTFPGAKFNDIVAEQWFMSVDGYSMYRVVTKMKALKKPLRKLLQSHDNLHDRVNSLRIDIDEVQKALDQNLIDTNLRDDVCSAVWEFFHNRQLLKEVNHNFLALIPKVSTPLKVTDYRSISCCNVLYKCISKIITNRIIDGLKEIVSENQSAFIPGRRISDNIIIMQELMHNYQRNRGPPRYAFKVDIQKAYDTVDCTFLDYILRCYGFHHKMVKWIMTYVTTASFSICINGDIHSFFK
ncbi:putative RNA-directed DNA polymerase, eukaryota, reverse transcriptase zinc-binding domain protein, partial [Tanacetum coccineum]